MKNMKKVPWHIIISAMILTMLVLATSKVFAHGEGRCFTSASRNTFLRNGSFMKVVDHLRGEKLNIRGLEKPPYLHGHKNQYYDEHGNKTTLGPQDEMEREDVVHTHYYYNEERDLHYNRHLHKAVRDGQGKLNYPDDSHHNPGRNGEGHDGEVDELEVPTPGPRRIPVNGCDPEPEPAPVGFTCDDLRVGIGEICHEWDFSESSFVGVPVLPDSIETIGDLWDYFYDLTGREIDIKFLISGWLWQTYKVESKSEIPITPHMGIGVDERTIGLIDSPIGIVGRKVQGETIILEKPTGVKNRTHFVGFPESPLHYETFGDLLVPGVSYVRRRILIDGRLDYQFIHTTKSEGADETIEPGDAVVMLITREVTLDLSGSVMSAPSVRRKGTLATSWGAMKR